MRKNLLFAVAASLVLSVSVTNAQDWPKYLGPNGNSVSDQKNLLTTWPQQGPEVLWSTEVGIGFGGPVVKAGKAYLLDRDDKTGDKLRCFDLATGKVLWDFGYNAPGSVQFPGSRSVPAIDENRIYTCGPYGDLYCIDINTHKPLWNTNIWTSFGGGQIPTWAITQCPLVYNNLVIVASQAPQAGVVAYDKMNGKVVWKTASLGGAGYVSPVLFKLAGKDQVVMISASQGRGENASGGKVVGLDPSNGKTLWEYAGWQCPIPVPTAIEAGDGKLLITGGYRAGAAMIKVGKKADGSFEVSELYKNPDFGAHTQPPVLINGYFYAQYTTNERRDGLVCMSIDGQVKWKTMRSPLFDKGGMIVTNGFILSTDGANKLYLIQPDPTGFKPVASAQLLKAESTGGDQRFPTQNWAPLALADGKLLIRDQSRLVCVKVVK
ncbi:MAG TPA: PQQ-binding-like beta-propeller repeat protein [Bacteroidales bacterium]|nr:PQQ-binding-like beta-propeller repeat protein [Bacteroidales bacterium]